MDKASAEDAANYSADFGLNVSKAELAEDGKTVTLTTNDQFGLTNYTLTVNDVKTVNGGAIDKGTVTFKGTDAPVIEVEKIAVGADDLYSNNPDAPIVTSTTSPGSDIVVDYNFDVTNANTNTVQLKDANGNNVPVSVSAVSGKITINLTANLNNNTSYTVVIDGLKIKPAANAVETYEAPKFEHKFFVGQAPTITISTDLVGDPLIGTDAGASVLYATSQQALDAASVNNETVKLIKLVENVDGELEEAGDVLGTVGYEASTRRITFTPQNALTGEANYRFVIEGVKNAAGIPSAKTPPVDLKVDKSAKPQPVEINLESAADNTGATDINILTTATTAKKGVAIEETTVGADIAIVFDKALKVNATNEVETGVVSLFDETEGIYVDVTAVDFYPVGDKTLDGKVLTKNVFNVGFGTAGADKLTEGHKYTLEVSGLKSADKNETEIDPISATFTVDNYAPTVTKAEQKTAAIALSTEKLVTNLLTGSDDIEITFDEDLDTASVTTNVKLYRTTGGINEVVTTPGITNTGNLDKIVVPHAAFTHATVDQTWKLVIGKDVHVDGKANQLLGEDVVYTFATNDLALTVDKTKSYFQEADDTPVLFNATLEDVAVNKPIRVQFNDTLAAASVNTTNFQVVEAATGEVVQATVRLNSTATTDKNKIVTITPSAALKNNGIYNLVVKDVTDEVGNKIDATETYTFSTETAAAAATVSIANNAVVEKDGKVVVKFTGDTAVTSSTDLTTLVQLDKKTPTSGTAYSAPVTLTSALAWNSATKELTIDLAKASVDNSDALKLTVNKSVPATGLTSDVVVNFSTKADTVAPTVKSIKQGTLDLSKVTTGFTAAEGLGSDDEFIITFNDTDISTSDDAKVTIFDLTANEYVGDFTAVGKAVTPGSNSLTIDPANGLKDDHKYRVTVKDVKDTKKGISNNQNVSDTITFDFITGPVATLSIAANTNLGTGNAFPSLAAGDTVVTSDNAPATAIEDVVIPVLLTTGGSGSDELDTTTFNADTIYVKDAEGNKVSATISYEGANHQPVIKLAEKLAYNTKYTVVVDGVKEVSGNVVEKAEFSFTTVADAATFLASALHNDAAAAITDGGTVTHANAQSLVIATGSTDLDDTTFTTENIKIKNVTDGTNVALLGGMFTEANAANGTAGTGGFIKLDIPGVLAGGKIYELTISGVEGVKGSEAEAVIVPKTFTFYVGPVAP